MRALAVSLLLSYFPTVTSAQAFGPLNTVSVPTVPNLERYVRDKPMLVVLGKALFWDMQVGSDGRTACATCHFHAGADHRSQNQLSNPDGPFEPNHQQVWEDFPFRVFAGGDDNHSPLVRDSAQRAGSAGIVRRTFSALTGAGAEQGADLASAYQFGNFNIRQVTTRNAPSVINAVFHVRSFRDGRASDVFTGRTPFGDSDPRANAVAVVDGQLVPEKVRLVDSSLASQAMAPPTNPMEMSYEGRTWPTLGKKLLAAQPLANQEVAFDDSMLGPYVNSCCRGLDPSYTYLALVRTAFQPPYWDSDLLVDEEGNLTSDGSAGKFTIAEFNFPVFFGLAIQAYESTLIADDTRFDRFLAGDTGALTPEEVSGFLVYQTRAFCPFCHYGPELSTSSLTYAAQQGLIDTLIARRRGLLETLFTDTGFFHTGVRPAIEDPGLDTTDDFGVPLSLAERCADRPLGIAGAFKVPGLRNIEFTGPYFHNGGQASLEQVVDFYARGGDFPDSPTLPAEINAVPLTANDRADLVAFLKSLSDDRVRFERAPFDHPGLCVPTGYPAVPAADPAYPTSALDRWAGIPAVGRNGNAVPLQTFEELLKGVGVDGSRTHTLKDLCSIR
jgi:cytochrome c peroxidase